MTDLRKAAEALRLAEILSNGNAMDCLEHSADAANELFRLHEENKALRQALAQPEQKPVAWQVKFRDDEGIPQIAWFPHPVHPKSPLAKRLYIEEPLYTAPPKREWVGLTDEDWDNIFGSSLIIGEAIKVTEAKLKEKNT